jgi:hypothetical protein
MTPSVGSEADWELTEGVLFYAREANAEVGLAFILEYERALALLCDHPHRAREVDRLSYAYDVYIIAACGSNTTPIRPQQI